MNTTLVIMAAGMGSRFGGIKQLEPVGPGGEIIMDYSVYDAIQAGFDKIVMVIRKDIEEDFKRMIGNRLQTKTSAEVSYVFQNPDALPEGFVRPQGRTKPWGTGQAVLAGKEVIKEPFAVINADDYYGKEAFEIMSAFLKKEAADDCFGMVGYRLVNTLSENGAVTRGVCRTDGQGHLMDIEETTEIRKDGMQVTGITPDGIKREIAEDSTVSMNMMGFSPKFLEELDTRFVSFLEDVKAGRRDPMKAEYLLPTIVGELIKEEKAAMKVMPTKEKWFGVTYKEDKEAVVAAFARLTKEGIYPEKLWD